MWLARSSGRSVGWADSRSVEPTASAAAGLHGKREERPLVIILSPLLSNSIKPNNIPQSSWFQSKGFRGSNLEHVANRALRGVGPQDLVLQVRPFVRLGDRCHRVGPFRGPIRPGP